MIRRAFPGWRLEHSFALSTTLLVLLMISTTIAVVHTRMAASMRRSLEARGSSIGRSIGAVATPSLLAYNYPALQAAAEGAANDPGVEYVVIHDKEGVVAGISGDPDLEGMIPRSFHLGPREDSSHVVSLENGKGEVERIFEVVVPVLVEGVDEPWGAVRVALSYGPMTAELRRLDRHLLGLGLLLLSAAVVAARVVARKTTAPLRRLAEGTEALSAGNLDHRIPVQGARELADLARAFNAMADWVREKARESADFQRALEELNLSLERQVHDRTLALRESEAQYKTLVEHSPDSIVIVQDGHVRFVNPAFTETFGVDAGEALERGFDLTRIFDASSAALARGRIAAWERGAAASPVEVQGQDGSGAPRFLELRGSRIEYQGRPAAECLFVDMTEARRLRERLNETEKLRALGELAGGVAHDFNNLLGAILGRAQLLRRRDFDPDVDRDLSVIEKAAQDGRETVRRIQEFSRVRRDRRYERVDLGEVIVDAVEITRARWKAEAEQRNINVQVEVDTPQVPPVLGNPSELREVFTNLILNAVDAMPQGGRLILHSRQEGDKVVAEVRDTGVGMTEVIRRHLFDPFFTTKGSRGMGLGMSVVYGIVTRHEGKIEVDTALGKGTTFLLEFPVATDLPEEPAAESVAPPAPARPGRILVIDDEPEVAAVVQEVLSLEGHSVDTAFSGSDAIRMVRVTSYDLVLTDLGMPDMSGWDVAREVGEIRPDVPVALVTGWGSSLDEQEVRRRGIAAIVHKPFEADELVRVALEVMARAGARQPS